jgi:Calcium-dependent channel, 7TM region, putative phosphate
MCYSVISPLIVPFAAIVFHIAYITHKFQLLYVYETEYETGGAWMSKVFNMLCCCLVIFQFSTFGALVVQGTKADGNQITGRTPNLVVIALPLFTAIFWWFITYWVKPKADYVSLDSNIENVKYQREERFKSEVLKDRLFNPVIVELLPKVWVKKAQQEAVRPIYQPEFRDVVDFVSKTDPNRSSEITWLESEREAQRGSLERRKRSSLIHSNSDISYHTSPTSPNSHYQRQPNANHQQGPPQPYYQQHQQYYPQQPQAPYRPINPHVEGGYEQSAYSMQGNGRMPISRSQSEVGQGIPPARRPLQRGNSDFTRR